MNNLLAPTCDGSTPEVFTILYFAILAHIIRLANVLRILNTPKFIERRLKFITAPSFETIKWYAICRVCNFK